MIPICATCYNHERYMPDFVESMLTQTLLANLIKRMPECGQATTTGR